MNFSNEISINDICQLIIALIASLTFILAIFHFKTANRIKAIEEIFSHLEYLCSVYPSLLNLYLLLSDYHKKNIPMKNLQGSYEGYLELKAKSMNTELKSLDFEIIPRLEMLSRLYLSNRKTIQLKVLSINRMFRDLIDITLNMNWMINEMFWKDGFPDINKLNNYIDQLENKLVDEIGFSKGSTKLREKIRKYTEKEFKSELYDSKMR